MLQIVPAEEWFAKVASIPAKRKGVSIGPQASKKIQNLQQVNLQLQDGENGGVSATVSAGESSVAGQVAVKTYVARQGLHSAKRGGDPLLLGRGVERPGILKVVTPVFLHEAKTSDGPQSSPLAKNLEAALFNEVSDDLYFWWASLLRFLHCFWWWIFDTGHDIGHFWSHRHQCHGWPKSDIESHRFWHGPRLFSGHLTVLKESTAHYLAPEIMRIKQEDGQRLATGLAADLWSFGVLLCTTGIQARCHFQTKEGLPFWYFTMWLLYDFCRPFPPTRTLRKMIFKAPYPIIAVSPADRSGYFSKPSRRLFLALTGPVKLHCYRTPVEEKRVAFVSAAEMRVLPGMWGKHYQLNVLPVFSQTNFSVPKTAVDNDSTAIGFFWGLSTHLDQQESYSDWFFGVYQHIWIGKRSCWPIRK